MARRPDRARRILDAAMRLAAEKGWRELGLAEIAAGAGVPLSDVRAVLPSRWAILAVVAAQVDESVLSVREEGVAHEPRRDRLFDLLMRRFDALAPYKAGLRAILGDARGDPMTILAAAPAVARSMTWMLEAVGVPVTGLRGAVRANALSCAYLITFRAWLRDDSPDLSHTMAALDRALTRAESFL